MSATDELLDTAPVADTPASTRGAFASWYTVIILTLLYVLAFIDRQVIALLATPIKRDLGLLFGALVDRLTKQGYADAAPRVGLFTAQSSA